MMEFDCDCPPSLFQRKRKLVERKDCNISGFSMEELNQDLLERILSWLPTSAFFRLTSVCKRWKSVVDSASFKLACSSIPSRDPWFFMVDPLLQRSVVFDSAERNWKKLNHPSFLQKNTHCNSMPVASSSGLICFRNSSDNFLICNPVTGFCCELPSLDPAFENFPLHAIVMSTTSNHSYFSYKLILVFGELPRLSIRVYNSCTGCWDEEIRLEREVEESNMKVDDSMEFESNEDNAVYFLSKSGNVVATNMQRSPSKQYSSVITNRDGEEIVYFLSSTGTVIACNLTSKCFSEYPRLLPVFCEYSIDVVECQGKMLVVLLLEFFESASLRVWWYNEETRSWNQIAAMPPAMSHEWYGKKVDINCVGAGDQILICLNSVDLCSYVLYDLVANEWDELPKCCINGEAMEFMSAFAFEPRIEVSV